ncbi:ADP-ribosylation factor-related protein 1-like isoform X2 [Hylaeus volcanicus]|nr:ADP-ribosylation factor-related protein 1-like isoform X2 [Hylaeus volcanicus]
MTYKEELRFLIIGLDNSGKTTTFEAIKNLYPSRETKVPVDRITPTYGLNLCTISIDKMFVGIFWDLGGQIMLRSLWENYYSECDGIIFVLDSTDIHRMREVSNTMEYVLNHPALCDRSVPVIILANKQDLKTVTLTIDQLIEMLGLQNALKQAQIFNFQQDIHSGMPNNRFVTKKEFSYNDEWTLSTSACPTVDTNLKRVTSKVLSTKLSRAPSSTNTLTYDMYPEPLQVEDTFARIVCVTGCSALQGLYIKDALSILIEEAKIQRTKVALY